MTVPEENRPKTRTTDEVVARPEPDEAQRNDDQPQASGRTLREAMDEAGIKPEDYEQ